MKKKPLETKIEHQIIKGLEEAVAIHQGKLKPTRIRIRDTEGKPKL